MHSILQNPTKRIPLLAVDTETIVKTIMNRDLNPNYQLIQTLRSLSKSDPKYKVIKKSLQCFTPNASFSNYVDGRNISSSSGFVYMDFDSADGFDQSKEMDCLKKNPHVYASWVSAGGNGIGCLLKADWTDTNNLTYKSAFTAAFDTLKSYGSSVSYIDTDCSDLTRVNFISYSDVKIREDAVTIVKPFNNLKGDARSIITPARIKDLASPSSDSIPPAKLFYQSQIDDWTQGEQYRYYPDGKGYVNIHVGFDKIQVGQRTKRLFIFCCKLAVINPGSTAEQLFAHLFSINKRCCTIPKTPQDVIRIVHSVMSTYKEGRLYAPSTLKYVWFNPAYRLSTKQKQSIASKLIRNNQKNITFDLLEQHIQELRMRKIKITQKALADSSGKNVRTVKRYWDDLREFIF